MSLFTLTPAILNVGQEAFDTLINILGRPCQLYTGSETPTVCPNCIFNSKTGKSTGIYNGTGPIPFVGGNCPVCKGEGYLPNTTQNTQVITLLIEWKPNLYKFFQEGIKVPDGLIFAKGYVTDLAKILQSQYIIIDYENAVYENNRFELWGEPTIPGNIIKNRYFESYWKRRAS
jgi:hypothetical protein